MRYKAAVLVAVLLLAAGLLAGCGASKEYAIGAVLDISGPASSLGVPERNTLQMLVDELNARGGIKGHPVRLTILDNESDETKALLAAKKLVEQQKVLAVLGCSTTGTSLAMIDTVQKNQVPMISMAAAAKIVEPVQDRKWVFKTAQNDILVANKIARYLADKGLKKVAFLYINNAYGDGGREAFSRAAPAHGLEIVVTEKFEATDKDMTAQLTRVKASPAQATVVWAIPPSAAIVTKNYRMLQMTQPLIQTHGIGNKDFIDLAGEAANGVVFPAGKLLVAEQLPDSDPQKAVLLQYKQSYRARFNAEPSTFGGHAWDAFYLLVKALEQAGPDRAKIRDALENTREFVGITGIFNMSPQDHNGLDERALVMVEIRDGRWRLI